MKVILFADSKLIPAVGDKEVHFFNTNSSTITEALNYLESENAETLIVYAELSLNGSKGLNQRALIWLNISG
ncbi:MAG: hypothetical protein IPP73_10215 [Chitinophagaceae bacterium]|nr:hypothetical protein [Chitinophagaceae bacterium]